MRVMPNQLIWTIACQVITGGVGIDDPVFGIGYDDTLLRMGKNTGGEPCRSLGLMPLGDVMPYAQHPQDLSVDVIQCYPGRFQQHLITAIGHGNPFLINLWLVRLHGRLIVGPEKAG